MKFSNYFLTIGLFIASISQSLQATQNLNNKDIQDATAKFCHSAPFIPSIATNSLLFGFIDFLKKSPCKRLAAYTGSVITGIYFFHELSRLYLIKNNPCLQWIPTYQQKNIATLLQEYAITIKNIFK